MITDVALFNPKMFEYGARLPALSLAYISAVLNKAGIMTQVTDLETLKIAPDQFCEVYRFLPRVVGFTAITATAPMVHGYIRAIKDSGYTGKVVVGGVHASLFPQEFIDIGADLVVTGECEGNIADLLDKTGIQAGKRAEINDIPLPDWEHHEPSINGYVGQYHILKPHAGVMLWTRGCPYHCLYCADLLFNKQPKRYRDPASIMEEMAYLKRRGIDNVYVYDDELVGSKLPEGWMAEVADLIEPLDMNWIAQSRCSRKFITLDLLKDMKRAGCKLILWGIESFSPNVLGAINKHETPADIWHALETAKEAGIPSCAFIMIGNYKETEADMQITEKALRRAHARGLLRSKQVFVAQIMPGTDMERVAKEEGWHFQPHLKGAHMKHVTKGTPWASEALIKKYIARYHKAAPVGAP